MKMGWPESIVAGLFCLLFVACSDRYTAEQVAALVDQHGWVKVPDTVEELLR